MIAPSKSFPARLTGQRRGPSWLAFLCGVGLLLLCSVASAQAAKAAPTDAERAGARAAATAGLEAFEAQNWQKALDYFARAESIIHSPVHLSYIGRAQAKLGRLVLAREALMKVVHERTDSPAAEAARVDAEEALADIEPRIPSLTIEVEGAAGRTFEVTVDGAPVPAALIGVPGPVDPGTRTLEVVSGSARATQQVTLAEAERKSITLVLPPPGPEEAVPAATVSNTSEPETDSGSGRGGLRVGSIVAFGVGAVGVGLGVGFGLDAMNKNEEASQACLDATGTRSCSGMAFDDPVAVQVRELDSAAETSRVLATVGFVVGGVGIATGVTLLVLSLQKPTKTALGLPAKTARRGHGPDWSVRPVVGVDYLGLAGTF